MSATSHQVIRSSVDSSGFDPDWHQAQLREYAESRAAWVRSNGRFIVSHGRLVHDPAGHPAPEKPCIRRHTAAIDPRPLVLLGAGTEINKAEIDRLRKVEQHEKRKRLRREVEQVLGDGSKVPTDDSTRPGFDHWVVLFQTTTERCTGIRVTPLQAAKLATSRALVVALGKPRTPRTGPRRHRKG